MPLFDHQLRQPEHGLRSRSSRTCALTAILVTLSAQATWGEQSHFVPGVRQASPGVLLFEDRGRRDEPTYYGYWDVRANRAAVYLSEQGAVTLADLVQAANGSGDGPTGMAHVIRDGASGIRIPWPSAADQHLLPGDLVVFHGHRRGDFVESVERGAGQSQRTVDDELVAVAFFGLVEDRPIVVSVPRQNATIQQILVELLQPPDVAKSVRVVRTDLGLGPLPPGTIPQRLVNGDVLVFDRGRMDEDALARSQSIAETAFPPAIPLIAAGGEDARISRQSIVSAPTETGTLERAADNSTAELAAFDFTDVPSAIETSRLTDATQPSPANAVEARAGMAAPDAHSENSDVGGGTPDNRGGDLPTIAPRRPESARTVEQQVADSADLVAVSARKARSAAAFRSEPTPTLTLAEPTPTLAFADLTPTPASAEPAPTLASLIDPSRLVFDDPLTAADSTAQGLIADFPLPPPKAHRAPARVDSSRTPAAGESRTSSAALNPVTIALGVLALAAMCFAVSVAWTRIDRTAQTLQQPISAQRRGSADASSRRRMLDRLIGNNVPIIEEQAQLPDRMDYHGEELGRRRLMLDQPHGLAGPHFTIAAEAGAPLQEPAPAMTSSFSLAFGGGHSMPTDAAQQDAADDPVGPAAPLRRVDRSEEMRTDTSFDRDHVERRPPSRLLERVLLAMERERRQ